MPFCTITTNTTTLTNTPTIELLTLLHQYESLHTNANDNLKSCIFNITKARKFRSGGASFVGGVEYSPNDVREELRAQVLLELKGDDNGVDGNNNVDSDESEPNLVNEDISDSLDDDGSTKNQHGSCGKGDCRFVLHLDGMKSVQQQRAGNESAPKQTNISSITESEGLRRRRGGNTATATSTHGNTDNEATDETNKWTTENELQPTIIQKEEERLRYADPLNLFGVPPPALRVAQTKSRCAIAYYVEVANLAREIMKITNQQHK